MIWEKYRAEWVRRNTCKFCEGNYLHSCSSYQCRPAVERAEKYFDSEIAREEIRRMNRKYVADIWPWMKKHMELGNAVSGAWLIEGEEKEMVIRFNKKIISKIEKSMTLKLIEARCSDVVKKERNEGGSDIRALLDGIKIREWKSIDWESIKNGIPYEVE